METFNISENKFYFHINNANPNKTGIRIVVTGFGPFQGFPINASWEAVKKLQSYSDQFLSQNILPDTPVTIYAQEIPVEYRKAGKIVPTLWSTYNPDLVVHVGVHNIHTLRIEHCARNNGYVIKDLSGFCPVGNTCIDNGFPVISSSLDMAAAAQDVSKCGCNIHPEVPNEPDPIPYLCEYIYYLSLNTNRDRSVFIHVPDLDKEGWTSDRIAKGIAATIATLLNQIQNNVGFVERTDDGKVK